MSRHFSANQYEDSFRAPRLSNWEVRRWYPHVVPRARKGHTKIIADDRGHLLPGVPRIAPWGHFKSTWQLPRRITRKLAKEIVSARSQLRKEKSSWEKRSLHHPLIEQESSTPPLPPPTKKERKQSAREKEIPVVEEKAEHFYKDEHDYTNPVGHDRTPKIINTAQKCREDIESYTETCKVYPKKENLLEKLVSRNHEADANQHSQDKCGNDSVKSDERHSFKSKDSGNGDSIKSIGKKSKNSGASVKSAKSLSSISSNKSKKLEADYISSQYAKNLAQCNLKHRPLPDTVDDQLYRALHMNQKKSSATELDIIPTVTAVGHKKFFSPGPTQCSKLKVYRPKTTGPFHLQKGDHEPRPKTGHTKELNEIDLAICWDLAPPRPEDEPKRPVHIDGSNGSVAPGIFTIVKHPDQELPDDSPKTIKSKVSGNEKQTAKPDINEKCKTVNSSAVMDIINNNTEDYKKITEIHKEQKTSCSEKYNGKLLPINGTKENNNPNFTPPGSSENSRNGGSKSSKKNSIDTSLNSDKLKKNSPKARSSPNLSLPGDEMQNKDKLFYARPCKACESKSPQDVRQPKPEYKMAFKAGVPNSRNGSPSSNCPNIAKTLIVPKPKTPFARKSYSIHTLAPPFSLWPGTTGMDYPEHWRLTSVYQQSYKPIELRKNPMIKGIFR